MSKGGLAAIGLAAAVLAAAFGSALAGDEDHDRARRALERGEVMPLRSILERIERDHLGEVVEVELEREHGRWIYEIRILRRGGALERLDVDARDGTVLVTGGRETDGERREGREGRERRR